MAINWGAWEYSGNNGMRVGIEVFTTSVSHPSSSVTFTFKVYTQNQYSYSDDQSLTYSGTAGSGSTGFFNGSGGGAVVLRSTKKYTYNYGAHQYGSSPGSRSFAATLSGAYNGVTPQKTVTVQIPARPYDNPATPSNVGVNRTSDTNITVSWTNHPTSGEPYNNLDAQRWDNVSNSYSWASTNMPGGTTSFNDGTGANRRYRYRVRAQNVAGVSGWAYSGYVQTTPAAPSNATVTDTSSTSVSISWTNNASSTNYSYSTRLEESVNGGAWTVVDTIAEGQSSASRSGLNPGSTYRYRVAAVSTVGASTTSSYSTTSTIQLMASPPAPTGFTATYGSDSSTTLDWTNNPSTDGPYEKIVVQRWSNTAGAWNTIANLGATAITLTDTGTQVDTEYQWRLRAENAAGFSAWVTSAKVLTTPDAPTAVTAKRLAGGAIKMVWTNNVSYSSYTSRIGYSIDDGATWTSLTAQSSGISEYVLEDVELTATYIFRARAASGDPHPETKYSPWVQSAPIQASTPPNAPVNLAPSGTVLDAAFDFDLTWQHSPSLDGSDQQSYQVAIREQGETVWNYTGQVESADALFVAPAGSYDNGLVYEWMVRTWGVDETSSPWSAVASFTTSSTPTVTINEPSSILEISKLTVDWTYFDNEATSQAAWEITLLDAGGNLLEARNGVGTTSRIDMATVIIDGESYTLNLRTQDGSGLWSEWKTLGLTADFIPPAESILAADYDSDSGTVVLTLTPTTPVPGVTLDASSVDVQRRLLTDDATFGDWETIAKDIAPDATIIDTTAPIASDGQYRAITKSLAPSSRAGVEQQPLAEERWLFLSGGPDFSIVCRMWANIEIKATTSRERSLYHFAGRQKPVMFAGEARHQVFDVAGLLDSESSGPREWERLIRRAGVVLLRDPLGRRTFGSVEDITFDRLNNGLYTIAFTLREVAYP